MVKLLFVLFAFGEPEGNYDATQRYNDSLLIYNTYRTQIKMLKSLKETERQAWYTREAYDDSLTVCAKLRLKRHNRVAYRPSESWEKIGVGIAYGYPAPGSVDYKTAEGFAKTADPKFRYIVYDKQTHFLSTSKLGKIIPYIKKLIFDKGRLLYIEKLNPVTLEKLEEEGEDLERKVIAVLKK